MMVVDACMVLLATLWGMVIYRKRRGGDRFERTIAAALPVLAASLAVEVWEAIRATPYFLWNERRLARTFALFKGITIYPGKDATTPILGTLHTPLSHILWGPAIFAKSPITAIYIGSAMAFTLFFAPVLWLHLERRPAPARHAMLSLYALLTCAFMLLQGEGMRYCAFSIHTDAAALCCATLAAGLIYRADASLPWRRLLLSSAFAVLSIWSKQTMTPLLLALCLFMLLVYGVLPTLRYAACLLASGLVLSSLMVALFGPAKAMLFNIMTLASHRPAAAIIWFPIYMQLEFLPAIIPLLLFALYWFFYERGPGNGWRRLFLNHRWLVFPLIAMVLLPGSIKALATWGGATNHIGVPCYFLVLGATLGMNQFMTGGTSADAKADASKLLAAALILVSLPQVPMTIYRTTRKIASQAPPVSIAYEYSLRHPGQAYFPLNPLASFFADHKFYHMGWALLDREVSGYPVNEAQFLSAIPSHFTRMAFPPGDSKMSGLFPEVLVKYLSGWQQIADPELPGWTVFERPSAALRMGP